MRIVIAAWHLRDFNVGIGRYCRNLIEAIAKVDHENEYEILMAEGDQPPVSAPNMKFTRIRVPLFRRQFWEQASHLLVKPYDVLHFPYDSFIVRKRGAFVATIHDLIPELYQSKRFSFKPARAISSFWMKHRTEKMDQILTASECSKQDIIHLLNVPSEKVKVVYLGVEQKFFDTVKNVSVIRRFGIEGDYLLYVGSSLRLKNPEVVIKAYRNMPESLRKQYSLVLVGDFRQRPDLKMLVLEKKGEKRIVFTGVVSEEDLLQLYRNATVFIFPYLYSGFCLPVLEAMASGVPTIVSNRSSFPEVADNAACLVDPEDADILAIEIERLLLDSDLRNKFIRRGLERASQFTWEKTAKETIEAYQQGVL
jgi:glycosyltransferase involved in cell wall biosynthesis